MDVLIFKRGHVQIRTNFTHQKSSWQNWQKLFFHVLKALSWSILIRIELSKFEHVADHLLFQCSQMDFWFKKYWRLQSFQTKSLHLQFSEFLITVKAGFGKLIDFMLWFFIRGCQMDFWSSEFGCLSWSEFLS